MQRLLPLLLLQHLTGPYSDQRVRRLLYCCNISLTCTAPAAFLAVATCCTAPAARRLLYCCNIQCRHVRRIPYCCNISSAIMPVAFLTVATFPSPTMPSACPTAFLIVATHLTDPRSLFELLYCCNRSSAIMPVAFLTVATFSCPTMPSACPTAFLIVATSPLYSCNIFLRSLVATLQFSCTCCAATAAVSL